MDRSDWREVPYGAILIGLNGAYSGIYWRCEERLALTPSRACSQWLAFADQ